MPEHDFRTALDGANDLLKNSYLNVAAGPLGEPKHRVFELMHNEITRSVWRSCRASRPPVVIASAGETLIGQIVTATPEGLGLALPLQVTPGPCAARFSLYDVPFLVSGELEARIGEVCRLSSPRLFTLDRRSVSRIPISDNDVTLRWCKLIGGAPGSHESRVVDLTPDGALLELEADAPEPPSTPFPALLRLGERQAACLCQIRTDFVRDGRRFLGVHLRIAGGSRALIDGYLSKRFPSLLPRSQARAEEVNELLIRSGYLALREGEGPSRAWHELTDEGTRDVAYRGADGALVGHISVTRIYPKAWIMHQLATLSGHRESGACRRMLYELVGSVPVLVDGDGAGVLAYFDRTSRWHQLFFEHFMHWAGNDSLAVTTQLDRFEASGEDARASGAPAETSASVRIGLLDASELVAATALAREQLPALTADMFGIHPNTLRTETLAPGLSRQREVLGLHVEGQLKAIALCETGDSAASLFNLVNMAQFYLCLGSQAPAVVNQLALLAAVRTFYRARGVDNPIIVAPSGTFQADQQPGVRLAEAMGCVAITGAALRQWENFCKFQMGQLYRRKSGAHTLNELS